MEPYWFIIGPLVVAAIGMWVWVCYVAGTTPRVGADSRDLDRDDRAMGDRA